MQEKGETIRSQKCGKAKPVKWLPPLKKSLRKCLKQPSWWNHLNPSIFAEYFLSFAPDPVGLIILVCLSSISGCFLAEKNWNWPTDFLLAVESAASDLWISNRVKHLMFPHNNVHVHELHEHPTADYLKFYQLTLNTQINHKKPTAWTWQDSLATALDNTNHRTFSSIYFVLNK